MLHLSMLTEFYYPVKVSEAGTAKRIQFYQTGDFEPFIISSGLPITDK